MMVTDFLIFLADDDADDRQFLIDAFTELPQAVTVRTFDNGVALMDALLKNDAKQPNIIFLDLFMPLMNGEECLDDIRAESGLDTIPVVIYSTLLDLDIAAKLKDKGANLYVQKPASFSALKIALARCVAYIRDENKGETAMADFILKY